MRFPSVPAFADLAYDAAAAFQQGTSAASVMTILDAQADYFERMAELATAMAFLMLVRLSVTRSAETEFTMGGMPLVRPEGPAGCAGCTSRSAGIAALSLRDCNGSIWRMKAGTNISPSLCRRILVAASCTWVTRCRSARRSS